MSSMSKMEDGVVDWSDLGRDLWSFLNGRQAEINYRFVDMTVEIPRDTGPEAPRAVWKVDGVLQVSTSDNTVDSAAGSQHELGS